MLETRMENLPDNPYLNARSDAYALLSTLLNKAPDSHLLFQLKRLEWHPGIPEELIRALTDVHQAARKTSMPAVENEFQAVFVGLGQGEVVPYASWYLEGLLMAAPLARLRRDLAGLGIARRGNVHEAEDHAGLVCETLALMGRSPGFAADVYARFFDEHVATWMFDFFKDVRNAPSARFYRSVAGLGSCLLGLDRAYLNALSPAHVH